MQEKNSKRKFDAVLLCALQDEFEAVLLKISPDANNGKWLPVTDSRGHPMFHGSFRTQNQDSTFTVLLARCEDMGEDLAHERIIQLSQEYDFDCLAMCGVCAGRPDKVGAGNILLGQKGWKLGPGKVKKRYSRKAQLKGVDRELNVVQGQLTDETWVEAAIDFAREFQEKNEHELRLNYPRIGPYQFKVHKCHILTVPDVTIDKEIFNPKRCFLRPTWGLEMEGFAIVRARRTQRFKKVIFAKGVQDHARPALGQKDKGDEFRSFAAFASGKFVIEFLRTKLPLDSVSIQSHDAIGHQTRPSAPAEDWEQLVLSANAENYQTHDDGIVVTGKTSEVIIQVAPGAIDQVEAWAIESLGSNHRKKFVEILVNGKAVRTFQVISDSAEKVYLPYPQTAGTNLVDNVELAACRALSSTAVGSQFKTYVTLASLKSQ